MKEAVETVEEAASADNVADAIITITQPGKLINVYEKVDQDSTVQQVFQSDKDTEVRSSIKAKLCELGLAKEVMPATF